MARFEVFASDTCNLVCATAPSSCDDWMRIFSSLLTRATGQMPKLVNVSLWLEEDF